MSLFKRTEESDIEYMRRAFDEATVVMRSTNAMDYGRDDPELQAIYKEVRLVRDRMDADQRARLGQLSLEFSSAGLED